MNDKISIEIVFSGKLNGIVEASVAAGELKSKSALLRQLANVYRDEISKNDAFMKPLRALDPDVSVRVVISE